MLVEPRTFTLREETLNEAHMIFRAKLLSGNAILERKYLFLRGAVQRRFEPFNVGIVPYTVWKVTSGHYLVIALISRGKNDLGAVL